jgi:hypothetical protein
MDFEDEKIYHHHVPRFYLLAWAQDNRIWWSGYGKVICSELTVVGGENHFYRLEALNDRDRFHLVEMMKRLGHGSLESNKYFLRRFTMPHVVRNILLTYDPALEIEGEKVSDWIKALDIDIANAGEDYQTTVENDFRPYLDSMMKGDAAFYQDDRKAADFLYGLMLQYNRTRRMREVIASMQSLFEDFRAVWTIFHQMMSVTAGASFYSDRKRFKIILLENHTNVPFITGDQPIVNLHGDPVNHTPPDKMELYYPLSPTKAMLYLELENAMFADRREVTMEEAHDFNRQIASGSFKQIFAATEDSLKMMECAI